jgi:amino acid transporter
MISSLFIIGFLFFLSQVLVFGVFSWSRITDALGRNIFLRKYTEEELKKIELWENRFKYQ